VVESRDARAVRVLLARVDDQATPVPDEWEARAVGVEELALAYLRESPVPTRPFAVEATR
jgi:hypothetical protein